MADNKVTGADVNAVHGTDTFQDWVGAYNYLAAFLNQVRDKHDALVDAVGSNDDLTTADKSSLIAAINEVNAIAVSVAGITDKVGDLTSLLTSDKADAVAAINEIYTKVGLPLGNIVNGASNVIEAINIVSGDVGDLTTLSTTDKSSLVAAVNELNTALGSIISASYATQQEVDDGTEQQKAVSPHTLANLGQGTTADALRQVMSRGNGVVYVNSAAPSSSLGEVGDVYLEVDDTTLTYKGYYKTASGWSEIVDNDQAVITGSGAPSGSIGNDGDVYIRTDSPGGIYFKASGSWGGPFPGSVEQTIPSSLTDLTDTPADYAGAAGKHIAVKSTEDGVEFVDPVVSFTDLGDSPPSYATHGGKHVVVKPSEDGLEFVDVDHSFQAMQDTPAGYSGAAGKHVAVKSTEDGLEFVAVDDSFSGLSDTPVGYSGAAGQYVAVKSTEDGLEFVTAPPTASEFIGLTDSPSSYASHGGKVVAVKSTEDGLEFVTMNSASGGVSNWVDLGDTPSSYVGAGGQYIAVKSTEDGLEFVTAPSGGGSSDFAGLSDTPASYSGAAGQYVAVNATESGLEFVTAPSGGGSSDFVGLTDTPASYSGAAGQYVAVKATEDGLEFVTVPSSGGASDFVGLSDTPASYSGAAGQYVAVNAAESGLEFVTAPSGGGASDFVGLSDTPASYAGAGGQYVAVNAAESGLEFVTAPSSGGASDFTGLTDTPASYAGAGGQYVAVKSTEDGLEFVTATSSGGGTTSIEDGWKNLWQVHADTSSPFSADQIVRACLGKEVLNTSEWNTPSVSFRLRFSSGSSGGITITSVCIGGLGDLNSGTHDGNTAQVTFGGQASHTFSGAWEEVISDEVTITINPATFNGLFIGFECSTGGELGRYTMDSIDFEFQHAKGFYKTNSTGLACDNTLSGMTSATRIYGLRGVEVYVNGDAKFVDLTDTPVDYSGAAGQYIAVKSTEDGLEFVTAPSGGGASQVTGVSTVTSDYTLAVGDENKYIRMNSQYGVVLTLPSDTTANIAAPNLIRVSQIGNGTITLRAEDGVTLTSAGWATKGPGSIEAIKVGPNEWDVNGNLITMNDRVRICDPFWLSTAAPHPQFMFKPDDPSTITTDGSGNITAATDAFMTGNDMSSTNGPAYYGQINGKNIATFNQNNLEIPWDNTTTEFTFACVFTTTEIDSNIDWWNSPMLLGREVNGYVNDFGLVLDGGKLSFVAGGQSGQNTGNAVVNDGNPHLVVVRWKTDGTFEVYVDGSPDKSGTTGTGTRDAMTYIHFGNKINNTFSGEIAEGMLWKYYCDYGYITLVEGYLAHKWGITLPPFHPWANISPCIEAM